MLNIAQCLLIKLIVHCILDLLTLPCFKILVPRMYKQYEHRKYRPTRLQTYDTTYKTQPLFNWSFLCYDIFCDV